MTPTIRIDGDVMAALKKKAKELDLIFEPPNATLRVVFGIDSEPIHQEGAQLSGHDSRAESYPTLVIHAPWNNEGGKPNEQFSVEEYLRTGVAKNYAISQYEVGILAHGAKVVILRNNRAKARIEGVLVRLEKTGEKTPQGILRYDVVFKDQTSVTYSYKLPEEKLTRRGIKVCVE